MARERIETDKVPTIFIGECLGDVAIHGWAEPALLLKGEYEVQETEKGYHITAQGDLRLSVPTGVTLLIEQVTGDTAIKHLTGSCAIDRVHGDIVVADIGRVEVNTVFGDLVARGVVEELVVGEVHGDLSARHIGALTVRAVYGDLVARRITGPLSVEEASGDVDIRVAGSDVTIGQAHRDVNLAYAEGQVTVANVHGDIRLRGGLGPGDHSLQARGDIVIRWPVASPVDLAISGKRIDNRLPLADVVEKDGMLTGRIGQGDTRLSVSAGGRVILKEMEMVDEKWEGFGADESEFGFNAAMAGISMGNIGARIEAEINSHLSRFTRDIETRFGPEFGQRIAEKVSRHTERAERSAERYRRKTDANRRGGAEPTAAPRKSASTEEQLKILKMVEAGTISPEEAGMLLEALEG